MQDTVIIGNLFANEQFCRKVLPFLKEEYFNSPSTKAVYSQINAHFQKYNTLPSREALLIDLTDAKGLGQDDFAAAEDLVTNLKADPKDLGWLVDMTEKFCKNRALHNALMDCVAIMGGKSKMLDAAMPEILTKALAVSFDNSVGHDYLEDAENRFKGYHKVERKIPFRNKLLNETTRGGIEPKTLNVILAGTGVGKTLVMCDMAASNLSDGLNVLYITNEMAEEKIAERIDAGLLNLSLDEIRTIPETTYMNRIKTLRSKTQGRLVIKEYPTSTASALTFKHLIEELRIKKNFIPDIVYIDYLNICISSRVKMGGSVNSYTFIKNIAEELRSLAVEMEIPVVSATQTTRSGFNNSDVDMTDTSESWGLPQTVDWMVALISTPDLDKLGQILIKQLKNRYDDWRKRPRFLVGIDRSKMRIFDLEESAQADITQFDDDAQPVFDKSRTGDQIGRERNKRPGGPTGGGGDFEAFRF